ncbi:hypothetical protein DESA109040_18515 [Deinococcus saxicola]
MPYTSITHGKQVGRRHTFQISQRTYQNERLDFSGDGVIGGQTRQG